MKKAAIATAAVGVGGSLLGNTLPQSSAKSDAGGCFFCCCVNGTGVSGDAPKKGGTGAYGYGGCTGVAGWTGTGVGVVGAALCGAGVGITAWGNTGCGAGPYGDLQQWSTGSKKVVLDAINGHGWLGVLTATPSSELDVTGTATVSGDVLVRSRVGIGTCSPNAKLCFGQYVGDSIFLYDSTCDTYGFGIRNSELRIFHGAFAACEHTSFGNYNGTCFTEFMRLTNQGNLGIGTTCPSAKLDAVSSGPACIPIIAKGAAGQTANLQQWEGNCGIVYAVINRAGSLGLGGVTNPHHVLCISGKAHASSGFSIGPCVCINTTLAVNGSFAAKTRTVGATSCLSTTDYAILATGTITLTLPPAKTQNGMTIFVKNTSTGAITVAAKGTDTIEGVASKTLTKQYDSLMLISNGSNEWFLVGNSIGDAFVS